ncbi:MAG TPA: hypothetical protein ENI87_07700 [bacterium]|nr:hypothetical protein [bacterium]
MTTMRIPFVALAACLTCVAATAQNFTVVPSQFANTDAIRAMNVAGTMGDGRQQILVGESRLAGLLGRDITAIEFRRSAADETYAAGSANLTVTASIAPHPTHGCSQTFAANVGPNPVTVFSGVITAPSSPPEVGPTVSWDPDNVVRIPFTTPFPYTGGTLCLDLVGTAIAGQESSWWAADAHCEVFPGQVTTDIGGGCGAYANADQKWSFVREYSLVPGGHVEMFAYGTPYGLAIAALGQKSAVGTPLSLLGFNAPPGCDLFLSTIDVLQATVFVPDPHPALITRGGRADFELKVPAIPQALGFTLATQWFDWTQAASSNAIEWTLATALPTLDMATVEGHPLSTSGTANVHIAPVLRLEYQ